MLPHGANPSAASSTADVVAHTLAERAKQELSQSLGKQLQRKTVRSLGHDGSIRALVTLCRLKSIPFVCCMGRKRFAYAMKVPYAKIAAVAILSSDGANDKYRAVVSMTRHLRAAYQALPVE